ncbi:hypothetical protein [Rhodococcus erythropolis]|uniref:hypothetical protein n=1 Tax=Rhodococcus erythropolis TaxID=1833 RepID=UPI001BEC89F8|nr:hypothetical protein [Rhodococcus erythropolis]MBT2268801.1 hypothetical protein [Rhodococcus erythropolis]
MTNAVVMRVNSDSREPAWTFEVHRLRSHIRVVGSLPRAEDVPQDIRDALLWWLQPETEDAPISAAQPAEERCQKWTLGDSKLMDVIQCVLPAGHECFHDYVQPATAEPAEEVPNV